MPSLASRLLDPRPLVALLIGTTAAFAVFARLAVESPWWLELSRYLPYPVYLAPPVLALVLAAGLGRAWRAASVAAVLVVAIVTMDFHVRVGSGDVPAGGHPVRLMTYNIKAYKAIERTGGFEALAREIALRDPDILVMQDTQTLSRGSAFAAGGPIFGLPNVFLGHGYVIAARVPLRGCTHRIDEVARLAYVECTVTVDGRDASLVTVHFDSPRRGLLAARHEGLEGTDDWQQNYAGRLLQSQALAARLAHAPRPLIVAGDLNAPEASPVVGNLLALGLRDAYSAGGTGWGYSYGDATSARIAFLRIDHILVSEGVAVVDAAVGNAGPSEHRPVIADLVLPP